MYTHHYCRHASTEHPSSPASPLLHGWENGRDRTGPTGLQGEDELYGAGCKEDPLPETHKVCLLHIDTVVVILLLAEQNEKIQFTKLEDSFREQN